LDLSKSDAAKLLRGFVNVPELSAVGNTQERAAFVALHVEGRTVREAAGALGVSKSQVPNLASAFQTKLAAKIGELRRKRIAGSPEYKAAFVALRDRLYALAEESGSVDYHWDDWELSREDLAECFGGPSPRFDDE
jgi:transposase